MSTNDTFDTDRVTAATFLVEVDGVEIGRFMEISGLQVEVETSALNEGGENGFSHQLVGRMKWSNLTLKRGITQQDTLFKWLEKSSGEGFAAGGNTLVTSTAAITLLGPVESSGTRKRLRAWEFIDAFPVKWRGPTFATSSSDPATEELEIAHHGFRAVDL
jgi:phage tail-like protein